MQVIVYSEKHLAFHDRICHSPKGWTDGDVALFWMIKDFDKQTRDKVQGHTHVLILDEHSSHYMPELLEYARDHNIMILGYPPHCTHALQGLDVVCFARMKETWKQVIIDFKALHRAKVTKSGLRRAIWQGLPDSIHQGDHRGGILCHWRVPV